MSSFNSASHSINFSHLALSPQQILKAAPFIGNSNTPTNNITIPSSDFDSSTLLLDPRDIADRTDTASFGITPTLFGSVAPSAQKIADSSEDLISQILSSTVNTNVGSNPTDISDFLNGSTPKLGVPYSSLFGDDSPSSLGILVDTDLIGNALVGKKSIFIEDSGAINRNLAPFVAYNDDVLQQLVTQVPTAGMRNLLDPAVFEQSIADSGLLSSESLSSVSGQESLTNLIASLGVVPSQSTIDSVYPDGVPSSTSTSTTTSQKTSTSQASVNAAEKKLLKQAITLLGDQLPDVIPATSQGSALDFILDFINLSAEDQSHVKQSLNITSALDADVLADSVVTTDGGDYDLGTAKDPFAASVIQQSNNPLLHLISSAGWLVPNAFNNGVVQANANQSDQLFGLSQRSNVMDGQGGKDTLYLGQDNDTVRAYGGDVVFARGGNDTAYVSANDTPTSSYGFIDGGAGDDQLILSFDDVSGTAPVLTKIQTKIGELVHILLNSGQQFLARDIEDVVYTDASGNIFDRKDLSELAVTPYGGTTNNASY